MQVVFNADKHKVVSMTEEAKLAAYLKWMGQPSLLQSETFGSDTVHGNVGSVVVKIQIKC